MSTTGKYTLLEMVQAILEKMDSDEVNSIWDTPESVQVAGEVRDTFRAITHGLEDRHRHGLITLESISDTEYFNQLKVPDHIIEVEELWYDVDDGCNVKRTQPCWLEPYDFIEHTNRFQQDCDTSCHVRVKNSEACLLIRTDKDPDYYTTFDNTILVFDSVNKEKEDTLQACNTTAWAVLSEPFVMEDSFVAPLRVDEFTRFLNESIDACFVHFKGVSNGKAAERAREQKVRGQNNRKRVARGSRGTAKPPYGRRPRR